MHEIASAKTKSEPKALLQPVTLGSSDVKTPLITHGQRIWYCHRLVPVNIPRAHFPVVDDSASSATDLQVALMCRAVPRYGIALGISLTSCFTLVERNQPLAGRTTSWQLSLLQFDVGTLACVRHFTRREVRTSIRPSATTHTVGNAVPGPRQQRVPPLPPPLALARGS